MYDIIKDGSAEQLKKECELNDVNVNETNALGETLLCYVCRKWSILRRRSKYQEKIDIIKYLLTVVDIDINQPDNNGTSPLQHACKNGDLELINMLSEIVLV